MTESESNLEPETPTIPDWRPVTDEELEAAYQHSLKMEQNREWYWRHSKQGGFESSFSSFDQMVGEADDPSKLPFMASGEGIGGVISGIKGLPDDLDEIHKLKLNYACQKLTRAGKGHLVRTLRLIARNGKLRRETIWQMMLDMIAANGKRQKSNITTTGHSWRSSSTSTSGRKRKGGIEPENGKKIGK